MNLFPMVPGLLSVALSGLGNFCFAFLFYYKHVVPLGLLGVQQYAPTMCHPFGASGRMAIRKENQRSKIKNINVGRISLSGGSKDLFVECERQVCVQTVMCSVEMTSEGARNDTHKRHPVKKKDCPYSKNLKRFRMIVYILDPKVCNLIQVCALLFMIFGSC